MEIRFTPRELDIMAVLWERGPSTVAEVRECLEDPLAYTTVLTVLRTLEGKIEVGSFPGTIGVLNSSVAGASVPF